MPKVKFTAEKKLEIIEAYKAGEVAHSQLREVYGMNPNEIYRWISKYEANGIAAFVKGAGNARYTQEFKVQCVKAYLRGEGSIDDIVTKYNISSSAVLRHWIKCYNANKELKDYDPKREVYMADARRKTTLEERKEIAEYCIAHGQDYKGTAYRLAAGTDFLTKVMGIGQTVGIAFAGFAPGLNPFDWLVGIVGAVGFRLLIYTKSKNAQKFRRDAEYGSARWGNEKDIKPFVDPKFENNIILTGTEFLTMNTRPKVPANARNLNCCVIGSSGSGKTRFWLTPQLLQAHSSFVVVDPNGSL